MNLKKKCNKKKLLAGDEAEMKIALSVLEQYLPKAVYTFCLPEMELNNMIGNFPTIPVPEGRGLRILSLGGGGVRGVILAVVIEYIEKVTGLHISDLFDYIIGTSTGGLATVVSGIQKVPGKTIRKMYEEDGGKIFGNLNIVERTGNLICAKAMYPEDGLKKLILDMLPHKDAKMSDADHATGPRCAVTGTNEDNLFLFRSWRS